jgi:RNA polymerase sigma factor (sigma-70 family)
VKSKAHFEALAEGLRALDAKAFEAFADYFGPRFKSYFIRRGLLYHEAEDLAASCITDVVLSVRKYERRETGSFQAWAFAIARTSVADWLRKHPLPSRQVPTKSDFTALAATQPYTNPGIVAAVQCAIARLQRIDQEIIYRRELGGFEPFDVIASELNISAGTARVRHLRALKKLENILMQDQRIGPLLSRGAKIRERRIV